MCSDGVTNILTDQEIADIVLTHVNLKGQTVATHNCAEQVIKFVEFVGGDDNATCLVIRLNGWGNWPIIDRTGELRQARLDDYNQEVHADRTLPLHTQVDCCVLFSFYFPIIYYHSIIIRINI